MPNQDAIEYLQRSESLLDEIAKERQEVFYQGGDIDESLAYDLLTKADLALELVDKAEQIYPTVNLDGMQTPMMRAAIYAEKGIIEGSGLGQTATAIENLKTSIQLYDKVHEVHYMIGILYGKSGNKEKALLHLEKAVELDPTNHEYQVCLEHETTNVSKKKEGCFIATAVYSSYDATEVIMLRYFRDNVLLLTDAGELFVKLYYRYSPSIAQFVCNHQIIKKIVGVGFLGPLVKIISTHKKETGNVSDSYRKS